MTVTQKRRNRYYRIASPLVARMLESIKAVAALETPPRHQPRSAQDDALRLARTCYDHLAGRLGVAIADALVAKKFIVLSEEGGEVTSAGARFLVKFGAQLNSKSAGRRIFCRACLDWSERRYHVAGLVGAEIWRRCLELGWLARQRDTRAVRVTPAGPARFAGNFWYKIGLMSASAQTPRTKTASRSETSPYLLQHKHNPVDWWPWGPEALAEAKRSNRPILLSVGYAACHWCHVMAHESFEDEATARVMNELFVNIKVDREERPDIDQIYMNALHLLGEQGGWPLTMFLTPAGEPVWGGTYFPKESRYGRPAFADVLREVARLFREEPDKIEQNRAALMARLADKARPAGKVAIGADGARSAPRARSAARSIRSTAACAARRNFRNAAMYGNALARRACAATTRASSRLVEHTLERICEGGIYDHLGGGFSRYSVDERWLVPHFEKMLYDNAQLLELLALAYQRSGKPLFRAARARDGRLARARDDHGGGRVLRLARCRFGRRGGQVLRLVAGRDRRSCWARKMRRLLRAPLRRDRRGQFRRP